jgi:murein L,D-transpeptidase YcbB/YkuD
LPGRGNALGNVKFLFPNNYNIYLHDTPAKAYFDRHVRAFSHGCVRVEKPFTLTKYLLRNDTSWTDRAITAAMNSGREEWVTLPRPVPVFLTYFTSWVDANGRIQFRPDIYGHDGRMAAHLFAE